MKDGHAIVPSKLNCPGKVPVTPLTLTAVRSTAEPPYACGAHATVVADVHALLLHTSAAVKDAVVVRPSVPKFNPLIVTVAPPLGETFAEAVLTTGAAPSKLPRGATGTWPSGQGAHRRSSAS
jgi:hypothetical protein